MSEESERAAKWEIFENYKKHKAKLSALTDKCREIGGAISVFGGAIANTPEEVTIAKLEVSFPKYAGAPAYQRNKSERASFPLSKFDIEELRNLILDYQSTLSAKSEALRLLREMGFDPEPDQKG